MAAEERSYSRAEVDALHRRVQALAAELQQIFAEIGDRLEQIAVEPKVPSERRTGRWLGGRDVGR